jgi:homocitrate synthase NifV
MNNSPIIVDTTLRDGEQAPGVSFSGAQKSELLTALFASGIPEVEGGIPAMGSDEQEIFRSLLEIADGQPLIAWNRMKLSDLEASIACGARHLHLSLPVSDLMISQKLLRDRQWALRETAGLIAWCRDRGATVYFGAEDASRADPSFLVEVIGVAQEAGAVRVRVADTLGCLTPSRTSRLIGELARQVEVPLEFHGHNDFGLATANALAALEAGARAISGTIGGLGERAGNTALEELIAILQVVEGLDSRIYPAALPGLCQMVATFTGRPVPPQKPIAGALVFTHESGIHVDGLLKSPQLYTFLDPKVLGRKHHILPGKHSGRSALVHCAQILGYQLEYARTGLVLSAINTVWKQGQPSDPWRAFHQILAALEIPHAT